MKPYTGKGDDGKTSDLTGSRIWKDDYLIEVIGTIDEATASIGLAKGFIKDSNLIKLLELVEYDLYVINTDILNSSNKKNKNQKLLRVTKEMVNSLEKEILNYNNELKPLTKFISVGGMPQVSTMHLARTIVRRVERRIVTLSKEKEINPNIISYLNRLSTLLFVLCRYISKQENISEKAISK